VLRSCIVASSWVIHDVLYDDLLTILTVPRAALERNRAAEMIKVRPVREARSTFQANGYDDADAAKPSRAGEQKIARLGIQKSAENKASVN
jgi:hypothetical protein